MPSAPSRRKNGKPGDAPIPRQDWFSAFAKKASTLVGKPVTFLSAFALIVLWAAAGPFFGFSETWQIVINTITTIVTFLIVFLIQNTQNRDTLALQVKLAEILLHMPGAPKQLADAEDMSEHQLERLHERYKARAQRKAHRPARGKSGRRS